MQEERNIPISPENMNPKYMHEMLQSQPSDINEHLEVLSVLAETCTSILELGTRLGTSTFSFIHGLSEQKSENKKFIYCVDPVLSPNANMLAKIANIANVQICFYPHLSLTFELAGNVDMLFIDSMHCYGVLKKELNRFHKQVNKFIVMHDTFVDAVESELVRTKQPVEPISEALKIPKSELEEGLQRAINEFLTENSDSWQLYEKYENNNGLTILKKI